VLVTTPNSQEESQHQPALKSLKAAEIAISDPLKAESRKARLYLLGVSLVGITIVQTGLVPQKLTTLGITFGEADRQSLLSILALVIVYFTLAFAIYGISDFLAWRYAYSNAHWAEVRAETEKEREASAWAQEQLMRRYEAVQRLERKVDEGLQRLPEELRTQVNASLEGAINDIVKEWSMRPVQFVADHYPPNLFTPEGQLPPGVVMGIREPSQTWLREAGWAESLPIELRTNLGELPKAHAQSLAVQEAFGGFIGETLVDPTLPLAPTVSWVRAMFEFLLPLLVSFYAIYALLSA
jgi:hypothetical protein